jgi:hypothetical protein
VVDDAVDERGRACSVGEHSGPLGKGEVGGHHEAATLVTPADDLEQQVGIAGVVGQVADLVDAEQCARRVEAKPSTMPST